MSSNDSLLLLSGGIDSVVLAHSLVKHHNLRPRALYINLERRPSLSELSFARKTAFNLDIPIEILDLSGLDKLLIGYVPMEYLLADEADTGDPPTKPNPTPDALRRVAFPALMSSAAMYAHATEVCDIFLALTKEQISFYPEIPLFLEQFSAALATLAPTLPPLKFVLPWSDYTKSDVIKQGMDLNVELRDTWSCFFGEPSHEGSCNACKARRKAFINAGIVDPTVYLSTP
jgi:7-cyano-7-deazaguanine synthase